MKCRRCKVETEKLYKFGKDTDICEMCLRDVAHQKDTCPVCGYQAGDDEIEVSLLLTPKGSTEEEKKKAPDVLLIVCPVCRVPFFSEIHFRILQGMARD